MDSLALKGTRDSRDCMGVDGEQESRSATPGTRKYHMINAKI